jgi:hypothetical protein
MALNHVHYRETHSCALGQSQLRVVNGNQFLPLRYFFQAEEGSLSILIISLFLLTLIFSLMTVNVSDAFLAKRALVNIGEVAISDAAHSLSLSRYYSGDRTADDASGDGSLYRVPIDCNQAALNFQTSLQHMNLRGYAISMMAWSCAADEVSATIAATIPTAVILPLGLNSATEVISASISATSIIAGSR